MIEFIKKYWDILSGAAVGLGLSMLASYELESIQLYYSIIILILVCIGVFRIIRQEIDKKRHKLGRNHNIVDAMVDAQKSVKAVSLAQDPTVEGEIISKLIFKLMEDIKKAMNKLKTFFSKFKGYMLAIAIAILSAIELCGGVLNSLLGGALTIKGVEILPIVTFLCAVVVGIISDGYTKEQKAKIKNMLGKVTTTDLVKEEIRKTLKERQAQLNQSNKELAELERKQAEVKAELEALNNTLEAKRGMFSMTPQLATEADVINAATAVHNCEVEYEKVNNEIAEKRVSIDNLNTTIGALKSQI